MGGPSLRTKSGTGTRSTVGTSKVVPSSPEEVAKGGKTRRKRRSHILDIKSIQDMLETAGRSGVSVLQFGDLLVRFHAPSSPRLGEPQQQTSEFVEPAEMGPTLGLESSPGVTADPETLDDFRQAQILLDSPLDFETEQIDRITGHGPMRHHEGTENQ